MVGEVDEGKDWQRSPNFGVIRMQVLHSRKGDQTVADPAGADNEFSQDELFDGDGQAHFERCGAETHLVVAGLITEFASH